MKLLQKSSSLCVCLTSCLIGPSYAHAEEWKASVFAAGRWNPMGLSVEGDVGPKFNLYPSESILLNQNFLRPFFFLGVSPARLHAGVGLEIQPVSIFGVKAFAGQALTFGTYGHLQTFNSSKPDWSDETRKNKSETPLSKNSLQKVGNWYVVQPYVQARLSDFGFKLSYGLQRYEFNLAAGQPYFFDPNDDMLLENKKWSQIASGAIVCETFQQDLHFKFGVSARRLQATYSEGPSRWTLKWGPFFAHNWATDQTAFLAFQWAPHHDIRKNSGPSGAPAIVIGHNTDWSF
jgi:hypothetical protein